MPRCTKGKSCKSTCINKGVTCRAVLPKSLTPSLKSALEKLGNQADLGSIFLSGLEQGRQGRQEEPKLASSGTAGLSTGTLWAREDADLFDDGFIVESQVKGTRDKIDWAEISGKSKLLGWGESGTVVSVKGDPDFVVKRGSVSQEEISVLKKLIGKDIGAELMFADMGIKSGSDPGRDYYFARIAMSKVPGTTVLEKSLNSNEEESLKLGDSYMRARADLHRAGIAHNDTHTMNILVDDKGRGRFVDFGAAQESPKAALSEALGVLGIKGKSHPADFQTDTELTRVSSPNTRFNRWPDTVQRVRSNMTKLQKKLYREGWKPEEIAELRTSGIRNTLDTYNKGAWAKLSEERAQELINELYEGI